MYRGRGLDTGPPRRLRPGGRACLTACTIATAQQDTPRGNLSKEGKRTVQVHLPQKLRRPPLRLLSSIPVPATTAPITIGSSNGGPFGLPSKTIQTHRRTNFLLCGSDRRAVLIRKSLWERSARCAGRPCAVLPCSAGAQTSSTPPRTARITNAITTLENP